MDPEKMVKLQDQMRHNQEDLKDFMKDLDSWETDMKKKEDKLKEPADKKDNPANKSDLPPVRNSLEKKKKRKKKKVKSEPGQDSKEKSPKRISGFDFKAWDKFDVDKACDEVESNEKGSSSSSEYETDEEWEAFRQKQQAISMKDMGNQYFKEGKLDAAIECYTRGIACDASNGLLPANRALALLKQQKYACAELDCTAAISIDPTYVKAFQRRGTARVGMQDYKGAVADFEHVLKLEPNNKLARTELEKLQRLISPPPFTVLDKNKTGVVQAIEKPPAKRSKKPLLRIVIDEVGVEVDEEKQQAAARTCAAQSSTTKNIVARDNAKFDELLQAPDRTGGKLTVSHSSDVDVDTSKAREGDTTTGVPVSPADIFSMATTVKSDATLDSPDGATNDISGVGTDSEMRLDLKRLNDKPPGNIEMRMGPSPDGSPRVPPVPATSFQLQKDWRILRRHPQQFCTYFKEILPTRYPQLFGNAFDADMLTGIITILKQFYLPAGDDVYLPLHHLTQVKRFCMTAMFMSAADKDVVKELIGVLRKTEMQKSVVDKLAQDYGV